jgi:hypothetical protein
MNVAARLDDFGRPAWIALTVLGFVVYWPVGLAILLFSLWSGRMGCWKQGRAGRWQQDGTGRMSDRMGRWCGSRRRESESSGNHAFDEYRGETLRRLEAEQREFLDFLDRLRQAKDKAEFDQFMSQRRPSAEPPSPN